MVYGSSTKQESAARTIPHPASATIRLEAGARLVPEELLLPAFTNDRRTVLHEQAAFLLDRHLRRLARMRNPVELRIARLLGRMKRLSAYIDLGFARLTDYAVERLGVSARRANELLQMDHRLRELPEIARAFRSGQVSHSQVRLLMRVATGETESAWLQEAGRMNVRRLEIRVREARASSKAGAQSGPESATPRGSESGTPCGPESRTPCGPESGTPAAARSDHSTLTEDEPETPLEEVSIPSPEWLRGRWEWSVEIFRRTAGAATPVWEAAEGIAADFLAGRSHIPAGVEGDSSGLEPEEPDLHQLEEPESHQPDNGNGFELFEEVTRGMEDESEVAKRIPGLLALNVLFPDGLDAEDAAEDLAQDPSPGASVRADDGGGPGINGRDGDAASLDRRLRELIRIRQNVAWHQGRLLQTFAFLGLHRVFGFESFGRYCREHLGLGIRRVRRLIALDRRLLELPQLADAYRRGELSWVKAAEISRVALEATEKDWIHLGRAVTVRRLREEAALAATAFDDLAASCNPRCGAPPGLDSAGRVQLCAPSRQAPVHDPAGVQTCAQPDNDTGGPGPESDTAGVQTCAQRADDAGEPGPESDTAGVQTCAQRADDAGGPGPATDMQAHPLTTRIRFRAPIEVARFWRYAISVCRSVEGPHLQEWECVARMLESFRKTWEFRGSPAWRRRYRTFERDGWRCRVPGCSSRRNLHEHHIVFRSQGGTDEPENLVAVCATHHHRCLHSGSLRCHRLPDGLLAWEFGTSLNGTCADGALPGGTAVERYVEDVLWQAARDAASPRGEAESAATTPASLARAGRGG